MNKYSCTIESISNLNATTQKLLLRIPDHLTLDFLAGQYLDIILPTGRKCSFSIASAPNRNKFLELHIRPTPGSIDSEHIDELIRSNATINIEAPKGDCFLTGAPHNPLILVAASTGITQMKCILEYLFECKHSHTVYLYWGVRVDADLYFDATLKAWSDRHVLFNYIPVVSEPEQCPDWVGRTGLLADVVLEDFLQLDDHTAYISGGPEMVYATTDLLVERGMATDRIHSDIYSIAPRTDKTTSPGD